MVGLVRVKSVSDWRRLPLDGEAPEKQEGWDYERDGVSLVEMDRMAEHRMEMARAGMRLLCWI